MIGKRKREEKKKHVTIARPAFTGHRRDFHHGRPRDSGSHSLLQTNHSRSFDKFVCADELKLILCEFLCVSDTDRLSKTNQRVVGECVRFEQRPQYATFDSLRWLAYNLTAGDAEKMCSMWLSCMQVAARARPRMPLRIKIHNSSWRQ